MKRLLMRKKKERIRKKSSSKKNTYHSVKNSNTDNLTESLYNEIRILRKRNDQLVALLMENGIDIPPPTDEEEIEVVNGGVSLTRTFSSRKEKR